MKHFHRPPRKRIFLGPRSSILKFTDPPEKNFPGSPVTDPPGKEFSWVPGQEFSVVLGHRPPKDFEFSLGHFSLDSTWEWLNSVVRRNRDGIFPLEWRSHERGKENFSMNHERHIIFSPRMA